MEVNLFGAIHLTRPALPALRQSRGLVVAISSVAGYTPLIARTGYAASKHALHGFFESLRTEVAADGIDVMLVCPSFIATGIDRNALGPDGRAVTHAQVVVGRRLQPDDVADRMFPRLRTQPPPAADRPHRPRRLVGQSAGAVAVRTDHGAEAARRDGFVRSPQHASAAAQAAAPPVGNARRTSPTIRHASASRSPTSATRWATAPSAR